jgi:hypothetical protein
MRVTALLELAAALALLRAQGAQTAPPVPTPSEIEGEVIENVKRQPLGDGTVEDLALPADFVRRVADRIVRSSYEERYRIVVRDAEGPVAPAESETQRRAIPWLAISLGALAVLCIGWILLSRRREQNAP